MMTRREMLVKVALGAAAMAGAAIPLPLQNLGFSGDSLFSPEDEAFLEDLEKASFQLFQECTSPETGMVKDRGASSGRDTGTVSSIAATGFGLTGLCIADYRRWLPAGQALERARTTLRFLWHKLPHRHGFFHHFVDWRTGARALHSEVSSIDTALLLCGVLTCRAYFPDEEIRVLATRIYQRMNWQWLLQGSRCLSHGWTPEYGMLNASWDSYSEHMLLYLLAMGAGRHAIPAEAWQSWRRPRIQYANLRYIDGDAPLYTHQYSHAWIDFRGRFDRHADYFENSVVATEAHARFCADLSGEFPQYSTGLWGITASDSPIGYVVWGGPPRQGPIDGSIVPSAAGGSLPFLPRECVRVLRLTLERHGDRVWNRFGFVDAFNSATDWAAPEQVAINTGITLLMAENARSGFVWDTFMRNEEIHTGLERAGFRMA